MDAWITEQDYRDVKLGFRLKQVLFDEKTEFQQLTIVDTHEYGRMMLLDGRVMITERDEFVYHEIIAHLPVVLHPDPKRVLVIGGGDGGTVRELARHEMIQKIVLCEIDGAVVEASRRFFPVTASGFLDPRLDLKIDDGIRYVEESKDNSFDVIIVDSTDPIGPGEGLFTEKFYGHVRRLLGSQGIMICQSESPWFPAEDLRRIRQNQARNFQHVRHCVAPIPTYPRGLWSFSLASDSAIQPDNARLERIAPIHNELHYLTPELVSAVFALPKFYQDKLNS
jgi:spermidine synthase